MLTPDEMLKAAKTVHFVGIGGSGMSPLAEILHAKGYEITGSDRSESDNFNRIKAMGACVVLGHDAKNVEGADLVVYTAAVSEDNPELVAAKERGIPLLERAKVLGAITRAYPQTIGVAGTHGKTTTTSMAAQILLEADLDPAVFIGGRLPLINANGRAGHGDIMVCEACEFLDHYLEMTPAIAVILNVDADHLNYFGTLENVIKSFRTFASKATGHIIYNATDANTVKAVDGLTNAPMISYGLDDSCDWYAQNIRFENGAYARYDLYHAGEFFAAIALGVPGEHNVQNSMAAAISAHLCGATAQQIVEGLAHFRGAGRRFEFLGTFGGVTVVDDYAHHPTEIIATLQTAKALPHKKVWAIFQPFTYTRTERHLKEFAEALSLADTAVVSDIMGSREVNTSGVHSSQITDLMQNGVYLPDFPAITDYIVEHVQEGDLVLTMGGGNVYQCARMIAKRLGE